MRIICSLVVFCVLRSRCATLSEWSFPRGRLPLSIRRRPNVITTISKHDQCFFNAKTSCRLALVCQRNEWVQAWFTYYSLCCSSPAVQLSTERWIISMPNHSTGLFMSQLWGQRTAVITDVIIGNDVLHLTTRRSHCSFSPTLSPPIPQILTTRKRCIKCDLDPCATYNWGYTVSLDQETVQKNHTINSLCGRIVKLFADKD